MKYRAFITYSRKDTRNSERWLHRTLEQYRVPKGVSGADERGRLGRFFLDDDELRASEHLGAALDGAIDESKDLIVVASPDAAQSVWVNKEIARFKRRGTARVFVIIARGRPLSDDGSRVLSPQLKVSIFAGWHHHFGPCGPALGSRPHRRGLFAGVHPHGRWSARCVLR
ncbi:MAG: toll/interleukin-1 receptor domain-containing protein [Flavobacteriales bacterium]|nr:toll/interleukin-1 receptor domain-containing protein [Flavobacteriales bacterium]